MKLQWEHSDRVLQIRPTRARSFACKWIWFATNQVKRSSMVTRLVSVLWLILVGAVISEWCSSRYALILCYIVLYCVIFLSVGSPALILRHSGNKCDFKVFFLRLLISINTFHQTNKQTNKQMNKWTQEHITISNTAKFQRWWPKTYGIADIWKKKRSLAVRQPKPDCHTFVSYFRIFQCNWKQVHYIYNADFNVHFNFNWSMQLDYIIIIIMNIIIIMIMIMIMIIVMIMWLLLLLLLLLFMIWAAYYIYWGNAVHRWIR